MQATHSLREYPMTRGCGCTIPTLRLAVPVQEIRFKHESVVYGVHELPVTWK